MVLLYVCIFCQFLLVLISQSIFENMHSQYSYNILTIYLLHKFGTWGIVGQKLYAEHSSYWMKKNIIYKMSCKRTRNPIVPYMWWQATSWHPTDKIQKGEIIQVTREVRTNPICFYHMKWVWVRAWRTYPINIVYRCTTKEAIQSKACWWHLKIKVRSQWQVTSFTYSNVNRWAVMMNIWGSHQDFFGERFREHQ